MFVADCQGSGRFRCHEDRVTHFPARTTVLGFNFLPKPKASKFEFRKFFLDLPAQAIFIAFSRALAPSGKHPKPIALSSYEKHPSTFRNHQFRGSRHSLSTICRITHDLTALCLALQFCQTHRSRQRVHDVCTEWSKRIQALVLSRSHGNYVTRLDRSAPVRSSTGYAAAAMMWELISLISRRRSRWVELA
jgi:hypothetical protein